MKTPLTGKQRRHLRALAHHLDPVIQIGKSGATDAVCKAADEALTTHELIKLRLGAECPEDRKEVATTMERKLGAHLAGQVGRTFLLYRRHPKQPKIKLPASNEPSAA